MMAPHAKHNFDTQELGGRATCWKSKSCGNLLRSIRALNRISIFYK
jgi:hypothetical protein